MPSDDFWQLQRRPYDCNLHCGQVRAFLYPAACRSGALMAPIGVGLESSQVPALPQDEGGFAPGFLLFDSLLTLNASRLCFAGLPFTAEARIETIETKHKGLRYRNTRTGDHYGRHK
jgi:hypothetical protein